MAKKYDIPDFEPQMANEPAVAYGNTPIHLDVTIEDNSMLSAVRNALNMIKGISSIRVFGIDKASTLSDPFAELDTTWGGNRDANDIAEELHSMRSDSRTIETW